LGREQPINLLREFQFQSRTQSSLKAWLFGLLMLCCPWVSWAAVSYSYTDLIGTFTNQERLAELPLAGEKSAEWT
jgi:hypothetical protein